MGTPATLKIAAAIQTQEGWFPGSRSFRNNNPGNLMYAGQAGATRADGGFASFATYQAGFDALSRQIDLDASRGLTLSGFLAKYAPASENDTAAYVASVERQTGFAGDELLSSLGGGGGAGDSATSEGEGISADLPAVSPAALAGVGVGAAALLWLVLRR